MSRSRPDRREFLVLWQKRASRKRSKDGGDGGTGVYMWEGTTSNMMAADRPYGELYEFLQPQSGIFWITPRISQCRYRRLNSGNRKTNRLVSLFPKCKEIWRCHARGTPNLCWAAIKMRPKHFAIFQITYKIVRQERIASSWNISFNAVVLQHISYICLPSVI
jgi:hypothetical protein